MLVPPLPEVPPVGEPPLPALPDAPPVPGEAPPVPFDPPPVAPPSVGWAPPFSLEEHALIESTIGMSHFGEVEVRMRGVSHETRHVKPRTAGRSAGLAHAVP